MDFAFKVDVDTRQGLREKTPRLLELFREFGVKASFFVPFGPDRSGVALRRIWERKGIVKKAGAVNPLAFYGLPTLFYGVLLPAPDCVKGSEGILRRIVDEGHELGVHGYDHIEWHDRLLAKDDAFMIDQIERSTHAYRKITGLRPDGFAAPGWQMKESCYDELVKRGYCYSSSVRGTRPFLPRVQGGQGALLEIPTTLPTLDELYVTFGEAHPATMAERVTCAAGGSGLSVHTIHAEMEGGMAFAVMEALVRSLAGKGVRFIRMKDLAGEMLLKQDAAREYSLTQEYIEGRPGTVTCQK